jgi:hypothetical protein
VKAVEAELQKARAEIPLDPENHRFILNYRDEPIGFVYLSLSSLPHLNHVAIDFYITLQIYLDLEL